MAEIEKRGPGRPPKNKDDDEQEDRRDLEDILSELPSNARVKVYRMDPEWCSGYLGQFYIAQNKTLTTEEIKNRFGGRVLQLDVHGPNGKYVKRKTIVIDDIPRRDGKPVLRDGTLADAIDSKKATHPLETMMGWGLPPNLAKQISNYYLGAGEDPKPAQNGNYAEMAGAMGLQKIMMDMMAQSNQSNMQMMQFQFEMQKNMMTARQDFEKNSKPKDPLGDVTSMIQVFRELNGMKQEFGGPPESMASQIIENTMPMFETIASEYMAYLKMKAQAEASRPIPAPTPPPALPQRQPAAPQAAALPKTGPTGNDNTATAPNPAYIAQQMAQMYKNLPQDDKTTALRAFMQAMDEPETHETTPLQDTDEINMESNENNGNMVESTDLSEYLEKGDLEILQHGGDGENQNAAGNIQNSEYTGPAQENDPSYRQGDS